MVLWDCRVVAVCRLVSGAKSFAVLCVVFPFVLRSAQMVVGDETAHASRDSAPISILRPFDRGYITNWEPEFEVRLRR